MERKLYKTNLCILFQQGHCARQSCSFVHGEGELRRFAGSVNVRKYPPHRRYSPDREGRGRHVFLGQQGRHQERGYSASRSPVARKAAQHATLPVKRRWPLRRSSKQLWESPLPRTQPLSQPRQSSPRRSVPPLLNMPPQLHWVQS